MLVYDEGRRPRERGVARAVQGRDWGRASTSRPSQMSSATYPERAQYDALVALMLQHRGRRGACMFAVGGWL